MNFPFAGDIVVVVAHPDDEVLWLGAAVPFARKIVMVLPGTPSTRIWLRRGHER